MHIHSIKRETPAHRVRKCVKCACKRYIRGKGLCAECYLADFPEHRGGHKGKPLGSGDNATEAELDALIAANYATMPALECSTGRPKIA